MTLQDIFKTPLHTTSIDGHLRYSLLANKLFVNLYYRQSVQNSVNELKGLCQNPFSIYIRSLLSTGESGYTRGLRSKQSPHIIKTRKIGTA